MTQAKQRPTVRERMLLRWYERDLSEIPGRMSSVPWMPQDFIPNIRIAGDAFPLLDDPATASANVSLEIDSSGHIMPPVAHGELAVGLFGDDAEVWNISRGQFELAGQGISSESLTAWRHFGQVPPGETEPTHWRYVRPPGTAAITDRIQTQETDPSPPVVFVHVGQVATKEAAEVVYWGFTRTIGIGSIADGNQAQETEPVSTMVFGHIDQEATIEAELAQWGFSGSLGLGPTSSGIQSSGFLVLHETTGLPLDFEQLESPAAVIIGELSSSSYIIGLEQQEVVAEESAQWVLQRDLLLNDLKADFATEPFEDGIDHQAEKTLTKAFDSIEAKWLLPWVSDLCIDIGTPNFASSVLRCLGRLPGPGSGMWRARLIGDALKKGNVEIRDAAVQAVEQWGEKDFAEVLLAHQEEIPWLQDYVQNVVDDLRS